MTCAHGSRLLNKSFAIFSLLAISLEVSASGNLSKPQARDLRTLLHNLYVVSFLNIPPDYAYAAFRVGAVSPGYGQYLRPFPMRRAIEINKTVAELLSNEQLSSAAPLKKARSAYTFEMVPSSVPVLYSSQMVRITDLQKDDEFEVFGPIAAALSRNAAMRAARGVSSHQEQARNSISEGIQQVLQQLGAQHALSPEQIAHMEEQARQQLVNRFQTPEGILIRYDLGPPERVLRVRYGISLLIFSGGRFAVKYSGFADKGLRLIHLGRKKG